MKLTMLGTGNALVTKCYNTCFLLEDGDDCLLVDAGGGNQILSRLEAVGKSFLDIHEIIVTHRHVDHIMGVIWMVRMIGQYMNSGKYVGDAFIYGHAEVLEQLKTISMMLIDKKSTKYIGNSLHFVPVADGECHTVMGHEVTFFDIHSTKAKQYGFSFAYGDGKRLVCLGDENYNETEELYARDADYLMCEAFCLYAERDIFKPYEKGHSTVMDACKLAKDLGVQNLILYHTEDKNIQNRKDLYTKEGKPYFDGDLLVPDDLESIEIK